MVLFSKASLRDVLATIKTRRQSVTSKGSSRHTRHKAKPFPLASLFSANGTPILQSCRVHKGLWVLDPTGPYIQPVPAWKLAETFLDTQGLRKSPRPPVLPPGLFKAAFQLCQKLHGETQE